MAKISVIIPVYNVEKYLKKCVDSVDAQTYTDYQMILVDDGSTDHSGALCDALAAKNPKIRVIHQENRGLGGARNTGIRHCETEYVLFLDSDDTIHPQLLQRCMTAAEEQNCDLVFFDLVSVDENGNQTTVYDQAVPTDTLLSPAEKNCLLKNPTACDKVYRTALFTDNDIYFPEKVWYEDLRTTPKILLFADRVMRIDSEPLYYYLQRSDSIMHTPDYTRMVTERTAAIRDLEDYYGAHLPDGSYRDILDFVTIYHGFLLPCLEMYRKMGSYKPYLDTLLKTVKDRVPNPLEIPYIGLLRKNEATVLRLALKRRYFLIGCITAVNRFIKGVKNV